MEFPWSHEQVLEVLPQRYPFLLIDRVDELSPGPSEKQRLGRKVVARKCVTANEEFFNGHFPGRPIMPGVLQIEAMAQAGGIAAYLPGETNLQLVIAGVMKAKFRRPVVPGDVLKIYAEVTKERKGRNNSCLIVVNCKMTVDGNVVSECEVLASISEKS